MTENSQSEQQVSAQPSVKKRRKIPWLLLGFLVIIGVGITGYFILFYDNSVEEKICDIDKDYSFIKCNMLSNDGKHMALFIYKSDNIIVIWNNIMRIIRGIVYYIGISPNGEHLVYMVKDNDKRHVVYDNNEGPEYDKISHISFIGTDSIYLIYVAIKDNQSIVVYDNNEIYKYDRIGDIKTFDGHWICAGKVGNVWEVRYDGNLVCEYDAISNSDDEVPIITLGSKGQWACSGFIDKKKRIIVDGKEDNRYDESWLPIFSKDGLHSAFCARKGSNEFVVIDGKEYKYYNKVFRPLFSDDGNHYAYIAYLDNKWLIVRDGVEYKIEYKKEYKDICWLERFSPDGKHLLYVVETKDNKQIFVIDGVPTKYPDNALSKADPIYNRDLTRWACPYVDDKNKEWLDIDNIHYPCSSCARFTFSDKGSRWALVSYNNNGVYIVCDAIEGPIYSKVDSPTFSSDDTHFAYSAEDQGTKTQKWFNEKIYKMYDLKKRNFIVLDGKEQRSYQWISYPVFTKDNKLIYYGIRDNVLYRITKKL